MKKKRSSGKILPVVLAAAVIGAVGGSALQGVVYYSDKQAKQERREKEQTEKIEQVSAKEELKEASDVTQIVKNVMPSVVAITNMSETKVQNWFGQRQTYQSESAGSGIIISQDADSLYIATNNHVVEKTTKLTVCFNDNSTATAVVKGTDAGTDLAVVAVDFKNIDEKTLEGLRVASLGNSDNLNVGDKAIAIGNALGYGQSVTTGTISALNREVTVQDEATKREISNSLIQTDAAINPGNSGGALLNSRGEVIGINSVKYSETSVEGVGYAIPVSVARPIIEELINREVVASSQKAYLGLTGVDVSETAANMYGMPQGIYITKVEEGSAADAAGIMEGCVITQFAGHKVRSMEEMTDLMQYYAAGRQVEVIAEVSNNGTYKEQTFTVTLGYKN